MTATTYEVRSGYSLDGRSPVSFSIIVKASEDKTTHGSYGVKFGEFVKVVGIMKNSCSWDEVKANAGKRLSEFDDTAVTEVRSYDSVESLLAAGWTEEVEAQIAKNA